MKHLIFIFSTCLLMFSVTAQKADYTLRCTDPEFDRMVQQHLDPAAPAISVGELAESDDYYLILDTRTFREYEVSHIPDAFFLGFENPNWSILQGVEASAPILVYCSIGYRSEKIGEALRARGFRNVYNLYGSIFEWVNLGHPVHDMNNEPVQKIHGYNKKWSRWISRDSFEVITGR